MKELFLRAKSGQSRILLDSRLEMLGELCGNKRVALITDSNVRKLIGDRFPRADLVIEIAPGEDSKSAKTAQSIHERLLDAEYGRGCLIVGIGGGVVTDLAGFVAATFLRGVDCGFAPTSLLAQVDASIGGKNGVNLGRYKNVIGTIRQPRFVLIDPTLLDSLPPRELRCGLAEAVKAAAIGDEALFEAIEERYDEVLECPSVHAEKIVEAAVTVKLRIAKRDETENKERRLLNFGHTMGHAVERAYGLLHGEAVAIGMAMAARLSVARGYLRQQDCDRLVRLLDRLNLPTALPCGAPGVLIDAISKDKKRYGDRLHFILLDRIGHAFDEEIAIHRIGEMLCDLR